MQSKAKGEVILAHKRLEVVELSPRKVDQVSVEENVIKAKEAGWWVNDYIRTDREISFEGKPPAMSGVKERKISISRFIPEGDNWETDKVVAEVGKPGLAFSFSDLIDLISDRDVLLEHGVRWLNAMGVRFRDSAGGGCVAYLCLEDRGVHLDWVGRGWSALDWFGSVGK